MSKKLKLILDTNVIIESFKLSVWDALKEKAEIITTKTVIGDEAQHYKLSTERKIPIDWRIESQYIDIDEPTTEELQNVVDYFDDVFLESLDPGEREIIALLYAGKYADDYLFCTADAPATRALALIGRSDGGISFEEVLQRIGFTKTIEEHFTKAYFDKWLKEGAKDKVQGFNLRKF